VGNIGSCARAVRSMGFDRLCVVAPRDPQFRTAPEAVALAAGAGDVLAQVTVYDTLAEALAGVQLAFATTGYAREFGPQPVEVRAAARACAAALAAPGAQVAFVFGPERTGLSNADVQRCHQCCSIPADPVRGSLNLSQAAQVVAYEARRELLAAAGAHDEAAPRRDYTQAGARPDDPPAGVEQTEAMFEHLARGLAAVGYLDPDEPKHLLARLRRLLLRARPTVTEVDILRGIASAMELPRRLRAGSKKPVTRDRE
jgi:tRNA/rRNA methyltransferase